MGDFAAVVPCGEALAVVEIDRALAFAEQQPVGVLAVVYALKQMAAQSGHAGAVADEDGRALLCFRVATKARVRAQSQLDRIADVGTLDQPSGRQAGSIFVTCQAHQQFDGAVTDIGDRVITRGQRREARSAFLPHLSAEAGQSRQQINPAAQGLDIESALERLGPAAGGADIEVPDVMTYNSFDARAELRQNIFDYSAWQQYQSAKVGERVAADQLAAAAGGCTMVAEMPLNSIPSTTSVEALDKKLASIGSKSSVDFSLWGGLVPGNLESIHPLADAGVIAFKAYILIF